VESKALTKNNGKLRQRQAPVGSGHGPFFSNVLSGQIDEFEQGHIGGKSALSFGHFAHLTVEASMVLVV
jgi:hypothetical protein